MNYAFKLEFKVRDYECDLQGVVNNSVYLNYLEHTRHEFLLSRGINFAELSQQGINLVVVRAELTYKQPLKSGDEFWVGLTPHRISKIRGLFIQNIYRKHNNALVLSAKIEWTALNPTGKPFYYSGQEALYKEEP